MLHDRELGAPDAAVYSELQVQAWILGLLAAIALCGFVLGIFAYITVFLVLRAGVVWHHAALAASGAVLLLSVLSHFLELSWPRGVLQTPVEMPRPFD